MQWVEGAKDMYTGQRSAAWLCRTLAKIIIVGYVEQLSRSTDCREAPVRCCSAVGINTGFTCERRSLQETFWTFVEMRSAPYTLCAFGSSRDSIPQ